MSTDTRAATDAKYEADLANFLGRVAYEKRNALVLAYGLVPDDRPWSTLSPSEQELFVEPVAEALSVAKMFRDVAAQFPHKVCLRFFEKPDLLKKLVDRLGGPLVDGDVTPTIVTDPRK